MGGAFFLLTLGCSKNQVDSRGIVDSLHSAGWRQTEDPEKADLLVCNTCAFITPAKEESIEAILTLAEIKSNRPETKLVVCGCFPQRNGEELLAELPEVDLFLGTDAAKTILPHLEEKGLFLNKNRDRSYTPRTGYDILPSGKAAYLKIAEGCDNCCAYCAIPLIRGPYRPRPATDILADAQKLTALGILELNLISQDTSAYRDPDNPEYRLPELLRELAAIPQTRWIRPLYLHPAHISAELITTMGSGAPLLPYFDIPIQHLSDGLLKRMGRHTTWESIKKLTSTIRSTIPEATLRTTIILGFPGETEEDVELLCNRLREIGFDKLGAFRYSEEEGTPAVLNGWAPLPDITVEKRYDRVMRLQQEISATRLQRYIGSLLPVLIEERVAIGENETAMEEAEETLYLGRSIHDAPDVDGSVVVSSSGKDDLTGSIVPVRITRASDYDLYGETQ